MNATQLTGIIYLTSGALLFIIIASLLRVISTIIDKKENKVRNNQWYYTIALKIIDISEQASEVKTFRLKREDGRNFPKFKAGQFVTLKLPLENETILRSYSITSSELNTSVVDITIKKVLNGAGSGFMHNKKVGESIHAFAPAGHFTIDEQKEKDIILIAGGIGITPMASIIKSSLELGIDHKITLFYTARTLDDLAFHTMFKALSKESTQFEYYPVLSREKNESEAEHGTLDLDFIKNRLSNLQDKSFFLCGPTPMADSIEASLQAEKVSPERVLREKFIMANQLNTKDMKERQFNITVNGKTIHYDGKQSLLDFLLDNGIKAYYSCKTGVCGTCKCKMTSGKVEMLSNSGLTSEEEKNGEILPCVSFPQSNLAIKLGED